MPTCGPICSSTDYRLDTDIMLHSVTNIWRIENFSFHEAIGDTLKSSPFCAIDDNEIKWQLQLKPNFSEAEKDYISFHVYLCSQTEVFGKYSVYLLDKAQQETSSSKGMTEIRKYTVAFNLTEGSGWGWNKYHEKNEYFKNNLLIDDALTFKCVLTYSTRNAVHSLHHECINSPLYSNIPECNLSHHFGLLLENSNLTDVVLSTNGDDYPAHKIILAACSPVFAAMFKHNAKENEENRVYINDIDDKVISEMLQFMYTGKCENLSELATDLLVAADKYDLARLKMICANELYEKLSVENATSVLELANTHGVKELKDKVIKFIVSKRTEVLLTEGWKNVQNVELVKEVCLIALARE